MNRIYRMKPHPKRVIWAGTTLDGAFGLQADSDSPSIGEALDASGLSEMPSLVSGGPDDGLTLCQVFERDGDQLLGTLKRPGERFPLLVKRLDSKFSLSVQVHPNDEKAQALAGEANGKSEAWYILAAEEGATVHLGFMEGVTLPDVEKALKDGGILSLMREISVKSGDVIPVPAGCAHTIGAGIYLFEVQQTSDLTYRLDDFKRLDEEQKPRELHLEDGLRSINIDLRPDLSQPVTLQEDEGGKRELLVDMGVFSIEKWTVHSKFVVAGGALIVVQGLTGACSIQIEKEGQTAKIEEGETLIIGADATPISLKSPEPASLIIAKHPRP